MHFVLVGPYLTGMPPSKMQGQFVMFWKGQRVWSAGAGPTIPLEVITIEISIWIIELANKQAYMQTQQEE